LETLAIIAYRQPVTKPEVDHIRGVDCGGTIRILLDRDLVRIVGKREEPGRPMLYGTTREFLSFFNLPSLGQLPSLREFSELSDDSQEEIKEKLGPSLDDLSRKAKKLRLDEEPAVAALDEAVVELDSTENKTRDAFAAQGITIDAAAEGPPQQTAPDNDGKAGDS
ncbi:MAG: SMC-Scp complex subunit ScpB, partial [Clostridia bacterium]|nr:SMC-Scp complex subunit ScpB [Deltaproteobacteria bacterium]